MQHPLDIPAHIYKENQSVFSEIRREYLAETFLDREISSNIKSYNSRRDLEILLHDYVSTGNVIEIDKMIAEIDNNGKTFLPGNLSDNPYNEALFLTVGCITMTCSAALDGGLPEHIAYTISDCYLRRLDSVTDIHTIYALYWGVLHEFCQAVHEYKLPSCSQPVHLCLEYISTHLHTNITLSDLSNVCKKTPNYISDLFYKELSMRPIAYIRTEKLKYAALLLKNTENPVAELSALLAFPSSSAFAAQFQKQYGMTPTAYRKA